MGYFLDKDGNNIYFGNNEDLAKLFKNSSSSKSGSTTIIASPYTTSGKIISGYWYTLEDNSYPIYVEAEKIPNEPIAYTISTRTSTSSDKLIHIRNRNSFVCYVAMKKSSDTTWVKTGETIPSASTVTVNISKYVDFEYDDDYDFKFYVDGYDDSDYVTITTTCEPVSFNFSVYMPEGSSIASTDLVEGVYWRISNVESGWHSTTKTSFAKSVSASPIVRVGDRLEFACSLVDTDEYYCTRYTTDSPYGVDIVDTINSFSFMLGYMVPITVNCTNCSYTASSGLYAFYYPNDDSHVDCEISFVTTGGFSNGISVTGVGFMRFTISPVSSTTTKKTVSISVGVEDSSKECGLTIYAEAIGETLVAPTLSRSGETYVNAYNADKYNNVGYFKLQYIIKNSSYNPTCDYEMYVYGQDFTGKANTLLDKLTGSVVSNSTSTTSSVIIPAFNTSVSYKLVLLAPSDEYENYEVTGSTEIEPSKSLATYCPTDVTMYVMSDSGTLKSWYLVDPYVELTRSDADASYGYVEENVCFKCADISGSTSGYGQMGYGKGKYGTVDIGISGTIYKTSDVNAYITCEPTDSSYKHIAYKTSVNVIVQE